MFAKACTLFLMLCATVSSFAQNKVIDEVVWVVGDEAILKSDVESERLNAQYQEQCTSFGKHSFIHLSSNNI